MKTMLVAVDGSTRAEKVLESAVEQATLHGAKLVILRVIGIPVELPLAAMAISPTDVAVLLERRAREELEVLVRTIPHGTPHEVRIEVGAVAQTICSLAQKIDAELIVIGSHGYGGLDHLLGTTAAHVVNHADRSVLVVRPRAASSSAGSIPVV